MTRRSATWMAILLAAAVSRPGWAERTLQLNGHLRFPANGDFSFLLDEQCECTGSAGSQTCGFMAGTTNPAFPRANWIQRQSIAASSSAGCSGGDARARSIPPPFSGNAIDYSAYVCGQPSVPADATYDVTAAVWFEGVLGEQYRFSTVTSDPVGSACPGCCGGMDCLQDQDVEECAGAIVIEYLDGCDDPPTPLCPGPPGGSGDDAGVRYPTGGTVSVLYDEGAGAVKGAETPVAWDRQTRFPAPAGSCGAGSPCVAAPGCGTTVTCTGSRCDAGGAPACATGATYRIARVVATVERGGDLYFNQLRDGWEITNVPVVCGAVTRLKLPMVCPSGDHGFLAGRFEVLGYEDEVQYGCDSFVAIERGPVGNQRRARLDPADQETACGRDVHTFELVEFARSDRAHYADDANYRFRAEYTLAEPGLPDAFANRVSTSSGTGTDLSSSGHALFSTCAVPPPASCAEVASSAAALIADPDGEGDWLYLCGDPLAPAHLRRCPSLAAPIAGCDLDQRLDGALCPAPPGPAEDLDLDPLVMAPGELQGCLILRGDGCGIAPVRSQVFAPCEMSRLNLDNWQVSFVAAQGAPYESEGADANGDALACALPPGCANRTAHGGEVLANLVSAAGVSCAHDPAVPPLDAAAGDQAFRFRLVPGQVGSLGGGYIWNRLRLNLDNSRTGQPELLRGGFWLNRDLELPSSARVALIPPQDAPGIPNPIARDLDLCLGRLTLQVQSSNADIDARYTQRIRGTDVAGPCGQPQVILADNFEGTVASPRHATFNLVLPAGDYQLRPELRFVGASGWTIFPPHLEQVACGQSLVSCVDGDGNPIANTAPLVRSQTPNRLDINLDPDCLGHFEETLSVWDCDQERDRSQNGPPSYWIRVTSDDLVFPDEAGFDQPLRTDDAAAFLLDGLQPLPDSYLGRGQCAPELVRIPLAVGDGPDDGDPRSGCTVFSFEIGDAPYGDPARRSTTVTERICVSEGAAPWLVYGDQHGCVSGLSAQRLCILAGDSPACGPAPHVAYQAPGEPWLPAFQPNPTGPNPDDPFTWCADLSLDPGRTDVTFRVEDEFGNRQLDTPVAFLGHCLPEARLPDLTVACENPDPGVPFPPRPPAATEVLVDAGASLEDAPSCAGGDDGLPGSLSYRWTVATGTSSCPENVSLADPDPADPVDRTVRLVVPDQVPYGGACEPRIDCELGVTAVEPQYPGGPECTAEATGHVEVRPLPLAQVIPAVFCEQGDPDGTSSYPLRGTGSSCIDPAGAVGFGWRIANPADCPATLVPTGNPAEPSLEVRNADLPLRCQVELTVTDGVGCARSDTREIWVQRHLDVSPGGPYAQCMVESAGGTTPVALSGTVGPGQCEPFALVTHAWSLENCSGTFDDTYALNTVLRLPNQPLDPACRVCLSAWQADCYDCVTRSCVPLSLDCPPAAALTGPAGACEDSGARPGEDATRVTLDLTSAEDAGWCDDHHLPDSLDSAWSVDAGSGSCPAGATVGPVSGTQAELFVPDQFSDPAQCEPVAACTVTATVTERRTGGPDCATRADRMVTVWPLPVADLGPDRYEFCETDPIPPAGESRYQLDDLSRSCSGGSLTRSYLVSGCAGRIDATDPQHPALVLAPTGNDVTCRVEVTVTDPAAGGSGCGRVDRAEVVIHARPKAEPGGPYRACREDDDDTPATSDVPLDGRGSAPASPGCGSTVSRFLWTLASCPASARIEPRPGLALDEDAEPHLILDNSDPVGPDCAVCLAVEDCHGCQSPKRCVPVTLCPRPTADFEPRLGLGFNGRCGITNPALNRVHFENRSAAGGCGTIVSEAWDFGPGGQPPAYDAPADGPVGSSPDVVFPAGTHAPSLEVVEDVGQGATCSDRASACGICVPSCVEVEHGSNDGATIRFQHDCRRPACTQSYRATVLFNGVGSCAGCSCVDGAYQIDPASSATLSILGSPVNATSVRVNAANSTCGSAGRLALDLEFPSSEVVRALQCHNLGCETRLWSGVGLRVATGLQCGGCTQAMVLDGEVPLYNGNQPALYFSCRSGSCILPGRRDCGGCP